MLCAFGLGEACRRRGVGAGSRASAFPVPGGGAPHREGGGGGGIDFLAMSGCTGENSWRGSAARAPEVEVVLLGEPSGMHGWLGPQSGLVWLRLREWDGSW